MKREGVMIELVRKKDSAVCDSIEEKMREMRLSYRTRDPEDPEIKGKEIDGDDLPFVLDEGRVIKGEKEIYRYLEDIGEFKKKWDKFQSDACYCDEEGNIE
jgi:hypothetical protein